jgi:cellulose synthase/poly-beta-1,6-N-acetylglucosamine synthase-like glycosyltransferase
MIPLLNFSNATLFVYYLVSNLFYLALLITAFVAAARHRHRLSSLRLETLDDSPFTPPISILVPAHNEASNITENVTALLSLDYPALQIIVINDGSEDETLEVLKSEFALRATSLLYVPQIASAPVRGVYTSALDDRLLVLDKAAGGTKADAANAGLNAATSPYVAVIDADSVLEKDALLRIGAEILSAPVDVVAVGGIVRVLNGSQVSGGQIREVRLPSRPIEVLQVIEYLRAFLIGREAWGALRMLPIISGAFGVFSRERMMRIGGFRANAIGEDIDLVVRMHRSLLQEKKHYRLPFIPEPTCWTQVPQTLRALGRQRARWQKGLLDVLWGSRDMIFRPRYGRFGCVMLPYLWVFELAAPVVEIVGLSSIVLAALLGVLSKTFLIQFAIYGYAFATLISIGAVVQEEITVRRYHRWTDVARLLLYCLAEHFPYRQINMWWRLKGMWQYLRGNVKWEESERTAFATTAKQRSSV